VARSPHHHVSRGEVHHRGDGAKSNCLRDWLTDGQSLRFAHRRVFVSSAGQANRDIGAVAGAIIIPGRFMKKIEQRSDSQGEGRQTRRRGKFTDHHVVRGEVQGGYNDPKGDRLGQGSADPEPMETDERRIPSGWTGRRARGSCGWRTVALDAGRERRRNFDRVRGASTAAAPISTSGIKAVSSRAAPASTVSPTVTYRFMPAPRPVELTMMTGVS